jgi:hypothetical protein
MLTNHSREGASITRSFYFQPKAFNALSVLLSRNQVDVFESAQSADDQNVLVLNV